MPVVRWGFRMRTARSAVLLGTKFHNWGPVSSEVRRNFSTAINLRPLTPDEAACLQEDARVVTARGIIFAAAIPRFTRHAVVTLTYIEICIHGGQGTGSSRPTTRTDGFDNASAGRSLLPLVGRSPQRSATCPLGQPQCTYANKLSLNRTVRLAY